LQFRGLEREEIVRAFWIMGATFALLGVAAGAFGAHGLRGRLTQDMLDVFEVAVRYQMYHALGLLAVAWATVQWPGSLTTAAGWLFVAGIVVFSGSLYVLSLTGIRWMGAITPIGGVAFIAGWAMLVLAAARSGG
jgi:uncharacterized membrane protein YgdD (TMEM256/DUF423 family)